MMNTSEQNFAAQPAKILRNSRQQPAMGKFILVMALTLCSCNKITPSGFWKGFDKQDLQINNSDRGPWGGHLAMYWKRSHGKFKEDEILKFASKNGCKLVEAKVIDSGIVNKWVLDNKLIFPVDKHGVRISIDPQAIDFEQFSRWIKGTCKLYKFDSGYVTVDSGTEESDTAYGYILLSGDYQRMSVYYLWGE